MQIVTKFDCTLGKHSLSLFLFWNNFKVHPFTDKRCHPAQENKCVGNPEGSLHEIRLNVLPTSFESKDLRQDYGSCKLECYFFKKKQNKNTNIIMIKE